MVFGLVGDEAEELLSAGDNDHNTKIFPDQVSPARVNLRDQFYSAFDFINCS
jgi:hypothetical protein